ncbi:retrovirus-related pol polyprotein from transposon TNT 1-94 [Tanacetum coccineum]
MAERPTIRMTDGEKGETFVVADEREVGLRNLKRDWCLLSILTLPSRKVIAYASRQLKPYEVNYPTYDLELAAVIKEAQRDDGYVVPNDQISMDFVTGLPTYSEKTDANQSKYIKEMFKKFGLEESKPMKTPMSSDTKLTKDEECESVDSTKYRGMICSLLYLTASRPDIMFSICLYARFQKAPKTSHLEAVKHIFRYIKCTTHLGLWYPKGTIIETVVYAESDHAGYYVDRKRTSGICTFVGCCLTSWFSKKKIALAISTTEAEYVSVGKACQQALWMKQALIDNDERLDKKGAIDLSKNLVQHSRTKHIEKRYHFLRDNV